MLLKLNKFQFCRVLTNQLYFSSYEIVLNSDDTKFGGHGRLELDSLFFSEEFPLDKKFRSIQVVNLFVELLMHYD